MISLSDYLTGDERLAIRVKDLRSRGRLTDRRRLSSATSKGHKHLIGKPFRPRLALDLGVSNLTLTPAIYRRLHLGRRK